MVNALIYLDSPTLERSEPGSFRHSEGGGEVHDLNVGGRPSHQSRQLNTTQIWSSRGVRNVKCDCTDGRHAVYERRVVYAFKDHNGDVVVKKSKMRLLALE
jgi:hypothetical protein